VTDWRGGRSNNEILDSLASSRLARALNPLTLIAKRNALLSLSYENTKILTLAFAYARSEHVEGDYAEFGVWTGRTFVEAWRVAKAFPGVDRRFFAFDSFAGLPEVDGGDATGRFSEGEFSADRGSFEGRLRRAGAPRDRVHIVEGFFDETLTPEAEIPLERVAIAWVDCDLYSSTVPVLDYLTPRLSQGAILLFDDWFCFKGDPEKGEAKACAEWLQRNPEITLVPWRQYNWASQAFIVRRAEAADASPVSGSTS
jgi:O-methyltransferase